MTTIDCKDIAALLSGLVDGEVSGDERHQAERHLTGCASCRSLLDEAESLDRLLAADAALLEELPAGFMDGVLARTTRAGVARRTLGSRWLAVGGWMAAAASLTLAFGFWVSDNRSTARPGSGGSIASGPEAPSGPALTQNNNAGDLMARAGTGSRVSSYHSVPRYGSMTLDAAIPMETYGAAQPDLNSAPNNEATGSMINSRGPQVRPTADNGGFSMDATGSAQSLQAGDDLRQLFERWRSDLWTKAMVGAVLVTDRGNEAAPTVLQPRVPERLPLSRGDAETLRSATTLLEMLMDADHQSFRDVERIRRIAENDNLIARIGDTRSRLAAMDRPAILAVESIVHRIVYGPVSLGDLSVMAKTVADLNLIGQLDTMTGRWDPRSSL